MRELLDSVLEALERGERLALTTAVRSVGSTPRHSAARLVVWKDGRTLGSIGGGTMELQAIADAQAVLAENKPRLVEYNLIGRGEGNLGLCGGTQEVWIEIVAPGEAETQLQAIRAALAQGEPVVLATLVRAEGITRLHPGSWQVVVPNGTVVGSLGNAQLDQAAIEETPRIIKQHYPQRIGLNVDEGRIVRLSATRRTKVEIFLDVIEPQPRLVIVGAGHIGAALTRQARLLDWRVEVIDDRAEFLTPQTLSADAMHLVDYDPKMEQLGAVNVPITPGTAVVVTTWGWDEPALRWLAGSPAFYVGLVASLRKATVIFEALRGEGVDAAWLERVCVPVGLDLGAESPSEIALAIMAEILAVARGKSGLPLREVRGGRIAAALARTPAFKFVA